MRPLPKNNDGAFGVVLLSKNGKKILYHLLQGCCPEEGEESERPSEPPGKASEAPGVAPAVTWRASEATWRASEVPGRDSEAPIVFLVFTEYQGQT